MEMVYMKWRRIRQITCRTNNRLNTNTVVWIRRHQSILLAVGCAGLTAWGAASNHPAFTFGLVAVGAIGYFIGIFTALVASLLSIALDVTFLPNGEMGNLRNPGNLSVTLMALEIVGYIAIAWLGQSHRRAKKWQLQNRKPNQEVPWAVVNEVRTSLSAIRFLLFPIDDQRHHQQSLKRATEELSRLEQMFKDLEN